MTPLFFQTSAVASLLVSQPPRTPLHILVKVTLLKHISDHAHPSPVPNLSSATHCPQLSSLDWYLRPCMTWLCLVILSLNCLHLSGWPPHFPFMLLLKLLSQTLPLPSLQLRPELSPNRPLGSPGTLSTTLDRIGT